MSTSKTPTIIPLFDEPCHQCFRPAQWYVKEHNQAEAVTFPCRCGATRLSNEDLMRHLGLISAYEEHQAQSLQRSRSFLDKEAQRREESRRLARETDVERTSRLWNEAFDALANLKVEWQ